MRDAPAVLRVMIAETDEIIAAVLRSCLEDPLIDDRRGEPTSFVVHRAPAAVNELAAVAAAHKSAVALIGPSYPRSGLVQAIPVMLSNGTRTLVVSDSPLDEQNSTLLLAGASGLLMLDDASRESVAHAVRTVAAGASALHPDVVHAVLEQWRAARTAPADGWSPTNRSEQALTAREIDILHGLREGLTVRMLAARLGIAEKTVEAHKSRLYAKLGAQNQAHAVRIASDRGLV